MPVTAAQTKPYICTIAICVDMCGVYVRCGFSVESDLVGVSALVERCCASAQKEAHALTFLR